MRSALSSFVPMALVLAACGGSVDVEDGGGAGGNGTTVSTSTTGTTGTTATTSVTSSATGTSSSSSSDGGGSQSEVSASVSVGQGGADVTSGQGGAGPGAGGSAAVTTSVTSTGSGTEPFVCGQVECSPGETCCASQQGFACIGPNDPCQGATLTCQSAANCSGNQICCLQGDFQNAESVCADQCEAGPAGPIQLCETDAECPPDVACQEAFGGFKVCTNGFPGGPGGP